MTNLSKRKRSSNHSGIFKIIIIYIIVGGLWIFFSDSLLLQFTSNIYILTYIATIKGLLFILVTGGLLYFLINNYANDIRLAEENLNESEKRFKDLANFLPQMIFEADNEGIIKFANLISYEMFGYTHEEISQGFSIFNALIPEDRERARQRMIDIIKGERHDVEEYTALRKNGTTFPILISASPIITNKLTTGLRGLAMDITDRKIMEQQLIKAKEKAEESDKLKSEFLAQMSHEIRTPLNVILSYNSFLREELLNYLDEDQITGFNAIESSGRRLIRTIDLILNMAELNAGKLKVSISEFDIHEVIKGLVTEFDQSVREKKLKLSCINSCGFKPLIESDEYIFTEVFQNLIDNAVKYTIDGEIDINIYQNERNKYCIEVQDTGIGIAAEYMDKIFIPFSQEDSGYSRKFDGNGLGLALVKNYLALINATISVESIKGKGSKFIVCFN